MNKQVDNGDWLSLREVVRLVVRPEWYSGSSSSVGLSGVSSNSVHCVSVSCVASQSRTQELRTPEVAYRHLA